MNSLESLPEPALKPATPPAPSPASDPTPSPAEPDSQPSTLHSQPASEPPTSSPRHRRGRVARLPREIRSRINQMLDDGLPFSRIIQNLGDSGTGLKEKCIGSWKSGGYQDYLREQQLLDEARVRHEFLSDLALEAPPIDAFQAAHKLAAALISQAIAEFGSQTFHDAVKANPLNLLRMLNALSRITAGGLKCERHLADKAERLAKSEPEPKTRSSKPGGISKPTIAELNRKLNLM